MKRALCLLLVACACVHIDVDRRVERGPTLRTFERQIVAEGGYASSVDAAWPDLTLTLSAYDVCRTHRVEEFAEDVVTEKTSSSAGPALATGVTNSLIGVGLLLALPLFSAAPNTRVIDGGGNYGPSDRTIATAWGIGLSIVGLPALAVGLVEYSQIGEERQTRKSEEVLSALDERCHEKPANGKVAVMGPEGQVLLTRDSAGSKVVFKADELRGKEVSHFALDGHTLDVAPSEVTRLQTFWACLSASEAGPLEKLSTDDVLEKLSDARVCRVLAPAVGDDARNRLEGELVRRHEPLIASEEPINDWDSALQKLAPTLNVTPQGNDIGNGDAAVNKTVYVNGTLKSLEGNIATVVAGAQTVFVFIPSGAPYPAPAVGKVVEVVGTVTGSQKVGAVEGPVVRAAWIK